MSDKFKDPDDEKVRIEVVARSVDGKSAVAVNDSGRAWWTESTAEMRSAPGWRRLQRGSCFCWGVYLHIEPAELARLRANRLRRGKAKMKVRAAARMRADA